MGSKIITFFFFLIFLLAGSSFFINAGFCEIYYVKNSGNDKASGLSDANAWATIVRVNDFAEGTGFSSGDVIQFKRGGIWTNDETLGINTSGHHVVWGSINGLTIQDYGTGNKPLFDCNSQQAIDIDSSTITNLTIKNIDASGMGWAGRTGNIRVDKVTNIIIDGVYIDGHGGVGTPSKYYPHSGIGVRLGEGDVTIRNCEIKNILGPSDLRYWGDTNPPDCHALCFYYNPTPSDAKTTGTVNIHDNVFHDVESDCMQLAGIQTSTNIYNNTLYNFGENAIDLKSCAYTDIYNNDMYRGSYGMGGTGGGTGTVVFHLGNFWPGYSTQDITIRDNYIHDSQYIGIRALRGTNIKIYQNFLESNSNAIYVSKLSNSEIYNNVIVADVNYACEYANCSAMRVYGGSVTTNLKIYNNTIYIDNANTLYGIIFARNPGTTGTEIKNNIIQMTRNSSSVYPLYVDSSSGDLPTVEYNCFYNSNHSNCVSWAGNIYDSTEQTAWRNAGYTGGLFGDPLLANPQAGDFTLSPDSPCRLPDRTLGAERPLYVPSVLIPPENVKVIQVN